MFHNKKLGLALSFIALSTPTFAADELPPIVVSATRSVQSTVTTPSSITVITANDIEKSGAQHIVDVLHTQASIQINDLYGNGSRTQISMRGFADNAKSNTLILIDGRKLNNSDLAAPDLSSISLKDIKQIEIIQGSAGTLYGDQAVGGVINIITKTPEKKSAYVEASLGSYNAKNISGSISNKVDNLRYRFSVENKKTDNYREHNKQDYLNFLARIDYKLGNTNLFFDHQIIDEKLELPGSLLKAQFDENPKQANAFTPDDFNDGKTNISRIGLTSSVSSDWNVEAEYTQQDSNIIGKSFGSDFTQARESQSFSPRLIGTVDSDNGDILFTVGVDYNSYNYKINLSSMFFNIDTSAKQKTDAVYVQSVIPVSDSSTLTVGGRHGRVEYNITDASAFPTGSSFKNDATVFEIGLSTNISKSTRVFIRADENYRFAKVDENTYTDTGVSHLETQTGTSFEIGSEWKNTTSSAKAVIYALNLKNEIDFDTTVPGPDMIGANINLDDTKRTGIVLEGAHQFTSKFNLNAQYSYIDATFDGGSFDGNDIPFVAKQNITLNAGYKLSTKWSTTAEVRHTSSRHQAADYSNSQDKLPAVTIVNAQIRYQHENWTASLKINNLTNEKYAGYATSDSYYSAPERNVTAKVRYNF